MYAQNSKHGPKTDDECYAEVEAWNASGDFIRVAYTLRKDDDDKRPPGATISGHLIPSINH